MANLFKHLVGAAIVLSVASGVAQASPSKFSFAATVTYTDGSLSGVSVGRQFSGSFIYDPMTTPSYANSTMAYYQFGAPSKIVANVAGHQVASTSLGIRVVNNFGGNVEDGIDISGGYPLSVDGTPLPNGSFGFVLHSKPGNTGVLTSTDLPLIYDVGAFDAHSSLNYGWLQRDGGQTGTILQFSVSSIAASVPEPGTYAMMLAGLGLFGGIFRRRSN
ncbi:MAG: PEP-CTERM sorting domain-containing protein [Pseudomonadota bacterium]